MKLLLFFILCFLLTIYSYPFEKEFYISEKPTPNLVLEKIFGINHPTQRGILESLNSFLENGRPYYDYYRWLPFPADSLADFATDMAENDPFFYTCSEASEFFTIDGVEKYIIVFATKKIGNDCHACTSMLGITILKKENNVWKPELVQVNMDIIGVWGQPPIVKLTPVMVGKLQTLNRVELHAQYADLNQGYFYEGVNIYSPSNGKYILSLNLITSEDNSGTEEKQWGYKSEYNYDEAGNIKVTTEGTHMDEQTNKIVKIKKTVTNKYINGLYSIK